MSWTSYSTFRDSLTFSIKWEQYSMYTITLLWGLNKLIDVKHLEQCLALYIYQLTSPLPPECRRKIDKKKKNNDFTLESHELGSWVERFLRPNGFKHGSSRGRHSALSQSLLPLLPLSCFQSCLKSLKSWVQMFSRLGGNTSYLHPIL